MLAPFGVEIVSAGDLGLPEPEETGTTFVENATLKALAAAQASGLPALADDSGLSVHALDGEPGVYTADWEGPTRDAMVGMKQHPGRARAARCARHRCRARRHLPLRAGAGLARRPCRAFHGTLDGSIVWPPRGSGGHGYDPCFQPMARSPHLRRNDRRREERHQPSRTGLRATGRGLLPMSAPPPRRLRALAVLQIEVPLLRFQQPRARRRRAGALAEGAAHRARACRARSAGAPRRDHLLRRRHALADGARDRRRRDRAHARAVGHGAGSSKSLSKPTRPRSRRAKFAALAEAGVNRVSLGVQSLDADALRFLGREHSADEAIAAIATARRHFARYSFDLIYARPGQTTESLACRARARAGARRRASVALPAHHRTRHALLHRPCARRLRVARRGDSRRKCSSAPRPGSKQPDCLPMRSPTTRGRELPAAII